MNIHDDPDDLEYRATMKLQMRQISDEEFHRFEGYAAEIFAAFGLDLKYTGDERYPKALY